MSNFEPSTSQQELASATDISSPSAGVNSPSEEELLSRAKSAVDAGEQSMRDAAEALGIAHELHGTSQAEMARAIGRSEAWVSYLLQWRRSGYKDDSPFGPKTKAARLKHVEERVTSGKSKPRKPRKTNTAVRADADHAQASAAKRKPEHARLEAGTEIATSTVNEPSTSRKPRNANTEAQPDADDAGGADKSKPEYTRVEAETTASTSAAASTSRKVSPAEARGNLKYAIDHWWPQLDDAGKSEITAYFLKKAGVRAS